MKKSGCFDVIDPEAPLVSNGHNGPKNFRLMLLCSEDGAAQSWWFLAALYQGGYGGFGWCSVDTRPKLDIRLCLLACALLCGAMSAVVAQTFLGGIPHVTDEISYTLQARLFADLKRVGPVADNASMWLMPFWNVEGPMFSPFPPGWPGLLAVGERYGLGAWVNPVLASLLPLVVYRIGQPILGDKRALVAALITAISPGVWLLGGSRMAHTSVVLGLGLTMSFAIRPNPARWEGVGGGLAAAYVVLARPFDAALLAAPLLFLGFRAARRQGVLWAWMGFPVMAGLLVLGDNANLTGDPFRFPMTVWFDAWQDRQGCNALGFGPDLGCAPTLGSYGHSIGKAFWLGWETLLRFDQLFLGVPGGTVVALWGAWLIRARLGWGWVALVVCGYALYWSPGRAFGARFWHPLYLVAPMALAAAIGSVRWRWIVTVLGAVSLTGLSRIAGDVSDRYWCVDTGLRDLLAEAGIDDGVVFIQGHGQRAMEWGSVGVDRFQCDPMLEAGDGWALIDPSDTRAGLQIRHALPDRETTAAFMSAHHPGRPSWIVFHDVESDDRQIKSLGILPTH
jgi:hypothetical protein